MGKYPVPCPFCPTPQDCRLIGTCPKELQEEKENG